MEVAVACWCNTQSCWFCPDCTACFAFLSRFRKGPRGLQVYSPLALIPSEAMTHRSIFHTAVDLGQGAGCSTRLHTAQKRAHFSCKLKGSLETSSAVPNCLIVPMTHFPQDFNTQLADEPSKKPAEEKLLHQHTVSTVGELETWTKWSGEVRNRQSILPREILRSLVQTISHSTHVVCCSCFVRSGFGVQQPTPQQAFQIPLPYQGVPFIQWAQTEVVLNGCR